MSDSIALVPPATPRSRWFRRFIVDYNPFFLLSALSMLAGSLALTNSLSWSPVRLSRIVMLTAAINVYELLLVAIGLFLLVCRPGRRDGAILLILEAFFLVDVAFLNAEIFTIDRHVGLLVNAIVLVLAIGKFAVIFRVLRVDWARPIVWVIFGELVALIALPGVLKFYATARGGTLPPMAMFIAWWMIAGIGAAMFSSLLRTAASVRLPWFTPLLAGLLLISLIAHAGTGQWVYDLRYWGADLSPMLAMLAFMVLHIRAARPTGVLLALATVFASGSHDAMLRFDVFGSRITPVHLASIAVYTIVAWTLLRAIFTWVMSAGAVLALVAIFGPSWATIRAAFDRCFALVQTAYDAVRPRTQQAWGIVGVVASFFFLAIGTVISVRSKETGDSLSPQR